MRISVLLIFVTLLAAGCGGRTSDGATPSPPGGTSTAARAADTPVSPPIRTPTPGATPTPAPVLRTSGSLVFLRGNDLWVAKLDGSGERQLTSGSLGAGFAGYTRDAAGNVDLYYTSEIALTGGDGPSPPMSAEFVVYRAAQDGGPVAQLFGFSATAAYDVFYSTIASVSPDGRHVAYADGRGIHRFDLEGATSVTLMSNETCDSSEPTVVSTCHGYYDPHWSPHGDLLLLLEFYYEGAQPVVIEPLKANGPLLNLGGRAEFDDALWSPDGQRLCLVPSNAPRAVEVAEADGRLVDLEPALRAGRPMPANTGVLGWRCAWAADGRLAMEYSLSSEPTAYRIAVFDPSLTLRLDIALPNAAEGPPKGIIAAWLPDGTGFLISQWEVATGGTRVHAIMLDGTMRQLPFVANRVLAAIP